MRFIIVCGARPNFMKIAPVVRAIKIHNSSHGANQIQPTLVHTGQHYDFKMSKVFFQDLELPEPDIYLGIGSGTHAEQTGRIMIEFEKILIQNKPDIVIVVGDVNSTLAAALASVKLHIPVAHVEAGLRSRDMSMPEEVNRLLTDAISEYLFTPSPDANKNLEIEGVSKEKIFLVGDIMVDSLLFHKERAEKSKILDQFKLKRGEYALLTLHRQENVDNKDKLTNILNALTKICKKIPIVFPIHPRTLKNINNFGIKDLLIDTQVQVIEPLGYIDFLKLEMDARMVLTDSGGIQEETTVLGIPCLTLRNTTERPITLSQGTNKLVGSNTEEIVSSALEVLQSRTKESKIPEYWDGKAAERIVNIISRDS